MGNQESRQKPLKLCKEVGVIGACTLERSGAGSDPRYSLETERPNFANELDKGRMGEEFGKRERAREAQFVEPCPGS